MRWTYEFTREAAPTLQQQLEWALQRQNRAFSDAIERRGPAMPVRRRMLVLLGVLVLVLIAALVRLDAPLAGRHLWFFGFAVAMGVLAIAAGIAMPSIQAASRRFAGRALARRAEAMVRPLAAKAPFAIDYELADGALHARCPALGIDKATKLADTRTVVSTPDAVFLFANDRAVRLRAAVYGAELRDAIVAAFVAEGASHAYLDRPVDGYVAPIPEAVIRSR